jgi:hypothetical protein
LGDRFDWRKVVALSAQRRWAKSGGGVTQMTAIGPSGLEFLNRHDNPHASALMQFV